MHGRFRIGLPKMHGRFRIGPPKMHGRFRIGPPQVSLNLLPPQLPSRGFLMYPVCYERKALKKTIRNRMDRI